MRINNNLMAMNTHRQLGIATTGGAKSMEKLSSGYRINRAGDDAAGLAISEKMRGQIRGLTQASRNAQDGISLIQTAEGALGETHAILQRMRELAVQAASDTNVEADRGEIQKEMTQLTSEINRIGNTTEFNTMKLVNGERSSEFVTASEITKDGTKVNVTKAVDQTIAVGTEPIAWDNSSEAKFDIGIAGKADNGFDWAGLAAGVAADVVITKVADGEFTVTFTGEDAAGKTLDINAELVSFDVETDTYSYNNQGIDFSFTSADIKKWTDGDSVTLDLTKVATVVGKHSSVADKTDLVITGTNAAGPLAAATATMTDITVKGNAAIQGVDSIEIEWDQTAGTFTAITKNAGVAVSTTEFSLAAGDTLEYNVDGISFDFTATGDAAGDGNIKGTFAIKTETKEVEVGTVVTPAVKEDRSLTFQVGANENQAMSLDIKDMRAAALGISSATGGTGFAAEETVTDGTNNTAAEFSLDVSSHKSAAASVTVINKAIETVSSQRSALGAVQNRLEHTIKNLDTSSENLQASEARIRDVDMAKEMMEHTKMNILSQAATAMLAQANQAPQTVLQLLR